MGIEKSFWNAAEYSKSNFLQQNIAAELIEQIRQDGVSNSDIIVDIGCGSGDITEKLSKKLLHEKIYAFDFDKKMIDYATEHHNDGTIEYITQDAGVLWEQLDERLKAIEGKVGIVWSNIAFHWVKNKSAAVENISRLLAPGGGFYAQIFLFREPFLMVENNLKIINNFFGTQEEQLERYLSICKNYGLTIVNAKVIEHEHTFDCFEKYCEQTKGYWNAVDKDLIIPIAEDYFGGDLATTIKKLWESHLDTYGMKLGCNNAKQSPNKFRIHWDVLLLHAQKQS